MPEKSAMPVQTPLNLVMPIRGGDRDKLIALLTGFSQSQSDPLGQALRALGNVHFAQFVFLEKGTKLGVFTIYDGEFDDYILSFVEHTGHVFNAILQHIDDGAAALVPVEEHRDDFLQFIRDHDLAGFGQFKAYPGHRAFDIQQAVE